MTLLAFTQAKLSAPMRCVVQKTMHRGVEREEADKDTFAECLSAYDIGLFRCIDRLFVRLCQAILFQDFGQPTNLYSGNRRQVFG